MSGKNPLRTGFRIMIALVAVLALAGCSDDAPVPMKLTDQGIVRDTEHSDGVTNWYHPGLPDYQPSEGAQDLGPEIVRHDPLLKGTPQPFDAGGAIADTGDQMGADAPKEDPQGADDVDPSQDPLIGSNRPKNWYWLRGRIRNGQVDVEVNGHNIGRFSIHMDKEITDQLRPGSNTVVFTPRPDISSLPVSCHLEVVFSQQEPGSLPVMVYDTDQDSLISTFSKPITVSQSPSAADSATGSSTPYAPPLPAVPVSMTLVAH